MKNHKLIRSRSGVNDAYPQGRCECGVWRWEGWTERAGDVVRAHRQHLDRVLRGKPEFHRNAAVKRVQQIPVGPFCPINQNGEQK